MAAGSIRVMGDDPRCDELREALRGGPLRMSEGGEDDGTVVGVTVTDGDPMAVAEELRRNVGGALVVVFTSSASAVDRAPEGVLVAPWKGADVAAALLAGELRDGDEEADLVEAQALEEPVDELEEVEEVEAIDDDVELVEEAVPIEDIAAMPPPPPRESVEIPHVEISAEDRAFLDRVFAQVRDVDFRSPPPPPPARNLAGLDKKMHFLRQRVRELERDLARVGYVWRLKEEEVSAVERIIAHKEGQRRTADARYRKLKEEAAAAAQRHQEERKSLEATIDRLRGELDDLRHRLDASEAQRAQETAEFEAKLEEARSQNAHLVDEFRTKMEEAKRAFDELRERTTRRIAELERGLVEKNEELGERDKTVAALTAEMGRLRDEQQERIAELKATIAEREARIESLEAERESARQEYAHLAEQAEADRVRLDEQIAELKKEVANRRASGG